MARLYLILTTIISAIYLRTSLLSIAERKRNPVSVSESIGAWHTIWRIIFNGYILSLYQFGVNILHTLYGQLTMLSGTILLLKYVPGFLFSYKHIKQAYLSSRGRVKEKQNEIEDIQLQLQITNMKLSIRRAKILEKLKQLRRAAQRLKNITSLVRNVILPGITRKDYEDSLPWPLNFGIELDGSSLEKDLWKPITKSTKSETKSINKTTKAHIYNTKKENELLEHFRELLETKGDITASVFDLPIADTPKAINILMNKITNKKNTIHKKQRNNFNTLRHETSTNTDMDYTKLVNASKSSNELQNISVNSENKSGSTVIKEQFNEKYQFVQNASKTVDKQIHDKNKITRSSTDNHIKKQDSKSSFTKSLTKNYLSNNNSQNSNKKSKREVDSGRKCSCVSRTSCQLQQRVKTFINKRNSISSDSSKSNEVRCKSNTSAIVPDISITKGTIKNIKATNKETRQNLVNEHINTSNRYLRPKTIFSNKTVSSKIPLLVKNAISTPNWNKQLTTTMNREPRNTFISKSSMDTCHVSKRISSIIKNTSITHNAPTHENRQISNRTIVYTSKNITTSNNRPQEITNTDNIPCNSTDIKCTKPLGEAKNAIYIKEEHASNILEPDDKTTHMRAISINNQNAETNLFKLSSDTNLVSVMPSNNMTRQRVVIMKTDPYYNVIFHVYHCLQFTNQLKKVVMNVNNKFNNTNLIQISYCNPSQAILTKNSEYLQKGILNYPLNKTDRGCELFEDISNDIDQVHWASTQGEWTTDDKQLALTTNYTNPKISLRIICFEFGDITCSCSRIEASQSWYNVVNHVKDINIHKIIFRRRNYVLGPRGQILPAHAKSSQRSLIQAQRPSAAFNSAPLNVVCQSSGRRKTWKWRRYITREDSNRRINFGRCTRTYTLLLCTYSASIYPRGCISSNYRH